VKPFLGLLIQLYSFIVIARLIFSWIRVPEQGPLAMIYGWLYTVTEPPLRAIRRVVPPVRLGDGALDLSPIILLIALWILSAILGV
jgi:YggT family protein